MVTLSCVPPISQIMGGSSSFLCMWHPTRVCCHYIHQMTLPLKHIWVSSLQICEWAPSTYILPSQWINCVFSAHVESTIIIMARQRCVSTLHTRKYVQVSSSSYTLDKSRSRFRPSTVQEFSNPLSSLFLGCWVFNTVVIEIIVTFCINKHYNIIPPTMWDTPSHIPKYVTPSLSLSL